MKNIAFTILFLFVLSSICKAQPSHLYLVVEDNRGRRDTVEFGLKDGATLGIDTILGEQNIYLNEFDSLEIRSIQRNSANYNCLRTLQSDNPIYSEENIDLKIDYRPNNTGGAIPFSSIFFNFEFIISGVEYPITVYGNFDNIGFYDIGSEIALYDNSCNLINASGLSPYSDSPLFFLEDSSQNTLMIHLEHETGIINFKNEAATWNLFPNPGKDQLIIEQIPYKNSTLQIFDFLGKVLYSADINDTKCSLNIGFIPSGNYIIKLTNTKNLVYSSKTFIKSSN